MGKYGMNEIPIKKQFRQVSHAGEANQYARVTVPLPRRQYQPYDSGAGQIADGLGAFAKGATDLLGVIAEKKQESEKIADEVELTKLNNLVRQRLATISVTNDRELREGAQAFRDELAYQIANNENLSDRGRQQANLLLETAVGGYNAKGAAEIFRFRENQRKALAVNSINQAVESGDVPGVEKWFEDAIQHGVTPQYSLDKYKSMTFANGYFNSPAIQGMGIGALRNELTKISATAPDGSSKEFPMIKGDELENLKTRLKRRINDLVNAGEQKLDILLAQDQLTPDIVDALVQQGIIGVEQGNAALAIIKNSQARTAAVIKADQKERQEQETARIGNAMFDAFDNMEVYSPSQLSQIEADINLQISRATADGLLSGPQRLGLKKELKKYGDDARRPDGGIRGTDIFKYAMTTISDLEKSGALSVGVAKDGWFGTYLEQEGKDDPAFQRKRAVELRGFITDRLMANPDATPDDVEAWIKGRVEALNQGVIQKLYQPIPEPEVGHYYPGKQQADKIVGGSPMFTTTGPGGIMFDFSNKEGRFGFLSDIRLSNGESIMKRDGVIYPSDIKEILNDPKTGLDILVLKNGRKVWAHEYKRD